MSVIKEIVADKDSWDADVVTLANLLNAMKNSYANHAATFSQQLFLVQDQLDLDAEDIVLIQTELASIRQQINSNTEVMMKRIIINQPGPVAPATVPEP